MPNNSFDSPPAAQTGAQGVVPDHSPDDPVAGPVANAGVAVNLAGIIAAVTVAPPQPQPGTPFGNSLIPYVTPAQRVSEDDAALSTPRPKRAKRSQQEMTNEAANQFNQNGQSALNPMTLAF